MPLPADYAKDAQRIVVQALRVALESGTVDPDVDFAGALLPLFTEAMSGPRQASQTSQTRMPDGITRDVARFLRDGPQSFILPVFSRATLIADGREYVVMEKHTFNEFCAALVEEAESKAIASVEMPEIEAPKRGRKSS